MDEQYAKTLYISTIRDSLESIGYQQRLLLENYYFSNNDSEENIDVAAFAVDPPSYRNACLGITLSTNGTEIEQFRSLGAPQILTLDVENRILHRWKTVVQGESKLIERIEDISVERIRNMILQHRQEWNPKEILRAKSIGFQGGSIQRDFFDTGLIPALDEMVSEKLDELLSRTIATSKHVYAKYHTSPVDYAALFRLIFRLMTAKLLVDRRHPIASTWDGLDAMTIVAEIENQYFQNTSTGTILRDPMTTEVAWKYLRDGFSLANISAIAISYVYEKTLVSDETRRQYRTHATPPQLAEYIVNNLPIGLLAQDDRRIFEPFAGHAPFLVAALERLRALLPETMNPWDRHAYFVRMLAGLELDTFARDAAIFSLMHADYPNPNGWNILSGDAFELPDFRTILSDANVVLCNPPYGRFEQRDKSAYPSVKEAYREVEALRRVLEIQPQMFGFVLPRSFIDGRSFRDSRTAIEKQYGKVSIVELPADIFLHSEVEPILLLAYDKNEASRRRHSARVTSDNYPNFVQTGTLTYHLERDADGTLWRAPQLSKSWNYLADFPKLKSAISIRQGLNYKFNSSGFISNEPRLELQPAVIKIKDQLEPFLLTAHSYVSNRSEVMRDKAHLYPWKNKKILLNVSRSSRGHWRMIAAVDEEGLLATKRFYGIWEKSTLPLEVIACILNGPVANAFLSTHTQGRDNTIDLIQQIPIPFFTPKQIETIQEYVREYRANRILWLESSTQTEVYDQRCRQLLWQIDAEILSAYGFSPRLERELLDFFNDHKRPGPVAFNRYYPEGFAPMIPWRIYISQEFAASSARRTLDRLPVVYDPILSGALQELED